MQDWLTVIIVLLILGILLDGIRRMRAHRRNALRMSPNALKMDSDSPDVSEDDRVNRSEFPSGGARVAARRDPNELPNVNQHLRKSYVASKQTRGSRSHTVEPISASAVNSSVATGEGEDAVPSSEYTEQKEPFIGSLNDLDADSPQLKEAGSATEFDEGRPADEPHTGSEPAAPTGLPDVDDAPLSEPEPEPEEPHPEPAFAEAEDEREAAKSMPDEVMIINVMAKGDQRFAGAALLQSMLDQGLRFGDMDIFHRYETPDGQGAVLFSVANMVVPGTFDLSTMEEFDTPGISMFLSLPIRSDSLQAYNLMVQAAQAIALELDGELKDENRSVMTKQTLEHERQRVIEYDRKRRLNRI